MILLPIWMALGLGVVLPIAGWLFWWWNDFRYAYPARARCSEAGLKLPPGYMGLPFLGEMLSFIWYFKVVRRPDDYINSKRHKYGDGNELFRTYLFGAPTIVAFTPSIIKFAFKSEDKLPQQWPHAEIMGEHSLAMVKGKERTRIKTLIVRSINQPDALRVVAPLVQPCMIAALESWVNKGIVTTSQEVKKVTFLNIGKLFVNYEPGPVLDRLEKYLAGIIRGIRALRLPVPGTDYYNALQCRKKAIAIFRDEMEKRRSNNDNKKIISDLLDGLMLLKDEEGKQLSDDEILDNIINVLLGGHDTTALATTWAVYYLAKYPSILQKLREENMSFRKIKNDQFVTSDEIFKLKYTLKVVDETIRIANMAPFLFRTATQDVEYKGYIIPKGWKLLLWIRYLHIDPENFQEPMCFNPDRWDEPMVPGTFAAFGGGSRFCAGNMLARMQIALFLHYLSTGYTWELVNPDARVNYLPHTVPEDGVKITIKKL